MVEQRASDLHFHAGNKPIIRHDGEVVHLPFRTLSPLETKRFLMEILSEEQRRELEQHQEIDFVYSIGEVARFRANIFLQKNNFEIINHVVKTSKRKGLNINISKKKKT